MDSAEESKIILLKILSTDFRIRAIGEIRECKRQPGWAAFFNLGFVAASF
jgi:hypothetical protein